MPDTPTQEKPVKPQEPGADQRDVARVLKDNPALLEWFGGLVTDETLRIFPQELHGDLHRVMAQRKVVAESMLAAELASRTPKRGSMTREQVAEWFRCVAYRGAGQQMQPQADLDVGGLITQALTPSVGSSGGFLAPDDFIAEVIKAERVLENVWPLITKRNTRLNAVTKPERSTYPTTASKGTAAKSASSTSSDDLAETSLGYTQQTWTMRYFDEYHPIRLDMLEDSPIDIVAEVTDAFAFALAINHEQEPLVGTGAGGSRPVGIFNSEAGITKVNINAAMSKTAYLAFAQNLAQQYRRQAVCVMTSDSYFDLVNDLASNVHSAQFLVGVLPKFMESPYCQDGKCVIGDWRFYIAYVNRLMNLVTSVRAKGFALDIAVVEKWDAHPTVTDAFRIGYSVSY